MDESQVLFEFDRLIASGIVLYDDKQKIIKHVDRDLTFQFVLTSALAKKPTLQAHKTQPEESHEIHHAKREGSDIDTRGFEIGAFGDGTHFLAANKFCFARPHLMLLTSDGHRKQYEALDENDLTAAWASLSSLNVSGGDYVVIYNCGQDGGCSRLHKHMQLMPMPEDCFAAFLDIGGKEPKVPFGWFYRRFESPPTPAVITKIYTELLEQATRLGEGRHLNTLPQGAACPHNVILTKRWIIVLPRRRAGINKEAGANAIGMLGYIAVATQSEMDNWLHLGLTETLRELGVPRDL